MCWQHLQYKYTIVYSPFSLGQACGSFWISSNRHSFDHHPPIYKIFACIPQAELYIKKRMGNLLMRFVAT